MEFVREKSAFRKYDEDGKMIAEVLFPEENGALNITRTFVDESLRGQKIAQKLIEKVIKEAQKNGKKISPTCSYAVKYFEKNTGYEDMLVR